MKHQRVIQPVVDLLRRPNGPRDRQLLYGDTVHVLEESADWSRITSDKDEYPGWVQSGQLGSAAPATHWISAPATHAYVQAGMKSPDLISLSIGSKISALDEDGKFLRTELGYVPKPHTTPLPASEDDPVAVAERFLGTPYLWGGNSRFGIDCSGLVQAGLLACGLPCPGDSGDQEHAVGTLLSEGTAPKRGDLLFWKGHVAWVSDDNTLLHANAHHMSVVFEPLDLAVARIKAQGDGPVTAHKRL